MTGPTGPDLGRPDSYWLAYYADWSGFRVFDDETECLRYAVEHHMDAAEIPYGADPGEEIDRQWRERRAAGEGQ